MIDESSNGNKAVNWPLGKVPAFVEQVDDHRTSAWLSPVWDLHDWWLTLVRRCTSDDVSTQINWCCAIRSTILFVYGSECEGPVGNFVLFALFSWDEYGDIIYARCNDFRGILAIVVCGDSVCYYLRLWKFNYYWTLMIKDQWLTVQNIITVSSSTQTRSKIPSFDIVQHHDSEVSSISYI